VNKQSTTGYLIFFFGLIISIYLIASAFARNGLGVKFLLEGMAPLIVFIPIMIGGWFMAHRKPKIDKTNDENWYQEWQDKHNK
jgi:hypothetical protein